tara:strand:- start:326 stop:1108 length:783 start_codon:yes stop_codon:yes gene_type:complete
MTDRVSRIVGWLAGLAIIVATFNVRADLDISVLLKQQQHKSTVSPSQPSQTKQRPPPLPARPPTQQNATTKNSTSADAPTDPESQFRLAARYDAGRGVEKNIGEAAKWYRRAAVQGHVKAQANLGLMYAYGHGVPKDSAEAVRWLERASKAGDTGAQYNVGLLYYEGRGTERDYKRALRWYQRAARRGNTKAMNNIGIMHALGHGVPKNNILAWAWFALAAESGDQDAAENRSTIGTELTVKQRRSAQFELETLKSNVSN